MKAYPSLEIEDLERLSALASNPVDARPDDSEVAGLLANKNATPEDVAKAWNEMKAYHGSPKLPAGYTANKPKLPAQGKPAEKAGGKPSGAAS